VRSYADLEVPLLRAVEELIDFVSAPGSGPGLQGESRPGPAPERDG